MLFILGAISAMIVIGGYFILPRCAAYLMLLISITIPAFSGAGIFFIAIAIFFFPKTVITLFLFMMFGEGFGAGWTIFFIFSIIADFVHNAMLLGK